MTTSVETMKEVSKKTDFSLFCYLSIEINVQFNGNLIINLTFMKEKGFWGFGVFYNSVLSIVIFYRLSLSDICMCRCLGFVVTREY